jgi:uncharacterized circularly permuted ATP-grasp superfamily protein
MFASPDVPRPHYRTLHDLLGGLSGEEFQARCIARDRAFRDQGITFSHDGEERPFPLDLLPRIIPPEEWACIEAGVVQRVRALDAFLADLYGDADVVGDGVVPGRLVKSSVHFHRQVAGIRPPNGVRVHVAGIDLVRDATGAYRVLEDNVRTPSGISYVVENRRTMTHVFPELFTSHKVRPVVEYPTRLLAALRAAAPAGRHDPTVVVLTPGIYNPAYFEHSFLARRMGVELVEGRDLVCRDGVVYMRTTEGESRVDVVYRRVDDEFLDPLQFRPDSLIGCPGILTAARLGNIAIANAAGNGVADDKAIYPFVPELIDYYLGERPVLENVVTYRLDDPDHLAAALARLDRLVVKPVSGSGGYGIVMGPDASDAELAGLAEAIRADPRAWIAQEVVQLSTSPSYLGDGFAPRHVDLRPFAINDGERVWVAAGGLTRVALRGGSLIVNSSQGGGSKDTWVLAGPEPREQVVMNASSRRRPLPTSPQDLGPLLGSGDQQQQQQ